MSRCPTEPYYHTRLVAGDGNFSHVERDMWRSADEESEYTLLAWHCSRGLDGVSRVGGESAYSAALRAAACAPRRIAGARWSASLRSRFGGLGLVVRFLTVAVRCYGVLVRFLTVAVRCYGVLVRFLTVAVRWSGAGRPLPYGRGSVVWGWSSASLRSRFGGLGLAGIMRRGRVPRNCRRRFLRDEPGSSQFRV